MLVPYDLGSGLFLLSRYLMGNDPAGWLAIDPENGIVSANGDLDRESDFAKNGTYVALVLAVDDGNSCMPGSWGPEGRDPLPGWCSFCRVASQVGSGVESLLVSLNASPSTAVLQISIPDRVGEWAVSLQPP